MPEPIYELRVCLNPQCQKEYNAQILDCMGVRFVKGAGYCPECSRRRFEEQESQEKAAKSAAIASLRRKWRHGCGIPFRFMEEAFETFKTNNEKAIFKKAYKTCLEYADNFPFDSGYKKCSSLLLFSDNSWGVGKTHLACSIAHRIISRWNGEGVYWDEWRGEEITLSCPVKVLSEYEMFMDIQNSYNYAPDKKHLPSEADIIRGLVIVPLLILDDLGKRRVQDPRFVQRILFAVIDGRYKSSRPMVVTANLSPEKLKVYMGGGQGDEASFDRLWEMIGGKATKMDGPSYRRQK